MDKLDLEIIRSLNLNARKSFRELARELRVSLSTISARVKKLENEVVLLGYAPIIDAEKLGYELFAIVELRISKGKLIEVQKKIAKDKRVYGVYDVTGEYDSIVMARLRNRQDLNNFIKSLLSMEYVERTNTHVVLNIVKEEKRVLV
ncbi:MAG: Lrp/AsnC family transcriptional regulator [Candidatus Thermoplasmatota archaeon]|nr:Lrp/AsnC family transcriptional regulator [Candidatus Thermoplasmatota archaeon]MDI6888002.1 Lrp/AsnC family transcriptional regulator [Candidatus Thermoplasmatota archaeon]